jgi:hypothetical protein
MQPGVKILALIGNFEVNFSDSFQFLFTPIRALLFARLLEAREQDDAKPPDWFED